MRGTASRCHVWKNDNREQYNRDSLRYPSALTDAEWAEIEPLVPPARPGGNKRTIILRDIVDGIMYVLGTGCQWRAVPSDLPPRSTLYDYLQRWTHDGTLERMHHTLYVKCRENAGRSASPTAAVIDSQSVKGAEKGGPRSTRRVMTQTREPKAKSATFWSTPRA
jgi:transposase